MWHICWSILEKSVMDRVLIVNNDFDTMTLLQTWLEHNNYIVTFTGSADEVPKLVRKFKPDVLIVDVLQGAVVQKLKLNEKTQRVPILLMTGYTVSRTTPLINLADDVIEKPFNLSLLKRKLEKLIAHRVGILE